MRFILLGLVLTLVPIRVTSQQLHWEATDGPWHGEPGGMAGDSSYMLCGLSDGELFHSTDNGDHWQANDTIKGGTEGWIYSLERYNGVWYSNVGRSIDNGRTWDRKGAGDEFAFASDQIYRAIGNGAAATNGMWRSSDNGLSWIECDSGLSSKNITAISASDSIIVAGVDSSFCISTDQGRTWTSGQHFQSRVLAIAITGSTVVLHAWQKYTVRSTDYGKSWPFVDSSVPFQRIRCFATRGDTLFAGSAAFNYGRSQLYGIYRSYDRGVTWIATNDGLDESPVTAIHCFGHTLWAASSNGLYYSSNDGNSWIPKNRGMRRSQVYSLIDFKGTLLASTPGVYRTTDRGTSWAHVGGQPLWAVTEFAANDTFCFANSTSGLFRSSDSGASWQKIFNVQERPQAMMTIGNTVFIKYQDGLHVSSDNGRTWRTINTNISQNFTGLAATSNSLYATTNDSILRSTDAGVNWNNTGQAIQNFSTCRKLLTYGDTIIAIGGVYSVDNGLTWKSFGNYNACYTLYKGVLFGATDGGIAISTDFGISWQVSDSLIVYSEGAYRDVLPLLSQILVDDIGIVIGTNFGVWRTQSPALDVKSKTDVALNLQNSPNPFKTSTTIHLALHETSFASLVIFDVTGREVRRIVSGMVEAGEHDIPFERGDLPAGVYFYRLTAGEESQTGSMVIE